MPSSTLPTTTRSSLQPVLLLGLVLLLLLAVGGSLISGAYPLSAHQAWQALLAGPSSVGSSVGTSAGSSLSNAAGSELSTVVWQLRLPRIAAALLVGMALATAGATYQAMFRNPLVSPDILGVAAGAGLGASFAILAGLPLMLVQLAAFGGGLLAVSCVVLVATRVRHHDPILAMVLAGVAIGTLFAAGISLVKVLADPSVQLPSITFWLLGGSFLLIADSFARSVAAIELPLGILTAFVGAPAFLLLLARQGRSA